MSTSVAQLRVRVEQLERDRAGLIQSVGLLVNSNREMQGEIRNLTFKVDVVNEFMAFSNERRKRWWQFWK